MAAKREFSARLWGVRGTIPCPGRKTVRYGGNTACVEILCAGRRIILDAGTGLRTLGNAMLVGDQPVVAHILLSHTHVDHITGLPFFRPAYRQGNRFELWNGHLRRQNRDLESVLCSLMDSPFFPVPLGIMHASMTFHDFDAGVTLHPYDDVAVRTAALNHPGGATAYRIEFDGRSICYVTDTEHPERGRDARIVELIAGSEIVIYDATFTDEEYPRFKGWGHSTWQEGVRLCEEAGAGRLVTFHHLPEHDDVELDRIAVALAEARPGSLVGREGLVLEP